MHDLPAIAKVHSVCFPDSYSSQLCKLKNVIGGGEFISIFLSRVFKRQSRIVLGS